MHLTKEQIEADFRRVHTHLPADRNLVEPQTLLTEARVILRDRFLAADVGITGANFLIAETGTSIIVTNEGNGDLTQTLPRVHIVLASIEKVVPTLEDVSQLLRVLARSATGQEMSVYTTFSTGPRRAGDPDGPDEYHVIILDNGRTAMLGGQFRDMLRCIRCGACMNHCPVYAAVGGHAYGWVYPGPMGAVLTPSIVGIENAGHLPNASTFCGRCEEVCPVRIPLPKLMRHWREREFERHLSPATVRTGLAVLGVVSPRGRSSMRSRCRSPCSLSACRASSSAASAGCRSPAAGRGIAISRRRRCRRSRRSGSGGCARNERPRDPVRLHPPLARRHRRRAGAPRRGRGAARRSIRAASSRRAGSCRPPERVKLFAQMVEAAAGTAEILPDARTSPPRSRRCCGGITCRCRSGAATIRALPRMPWGNERTLEVSTGASDGHQLASVSPCVRGRRRDRHAGDGVRRRTIRPRSISCPTPTSWWSTPRMSRATTSPCGSACARHYGVDALPRAVNLITGPSRSADIAQILILGAHGPRRLHVLVVEEAT